MSLFTRITVQPRLSNTELARELVNLWCEQISAKLLDRFLKCLLNKTPDTLFLIKDDFELALEDRDLPFYCVDAALVDVIHSTLHIVLLDITHELIVGDVQGKISLRFLVCQNFHLSLQGLDLSVIL